MVNIIFNMMKSKGPILFYSNYVRMEGLEIFKLYLKFFNYTDFSKVPGMDNYRYVEFHGEITQEQREINRKSFNNINNLYGSKIKIFLLSAAGAEGISLLNIRQVHILEPYWNKVRIVQVIGRANRNCSHKDLPIEERTIDIFKYMAELKDDLNIGTDKEIYEYANKKQNLI